MHYLVTWVVADVEAGVVECDASRGPTQQRRVWSRAKQKKVKVDEMTDSSFDKWQTRV